MNGLEVRICKKLYVKDFNYILPLIICILNNKKIKLIHFKQIAYYISLNFIKFPLINK